MVLKTQMISAFSTDTAHKTGFTDRSIRQDIQIATKLDGKIRAARRKRLYKATYPESQAERKRLKGLNTSAEIISAPSESEMISFSVDTAARGSMRRSIRRRKRERPKLLG